ncbi:MAG TPA: phosphatase PAP2 family protein [Dehalococcoidia bacterium]|nr:phosphatase PAP2 family protein [Dehalococcoidia bacterium]
MARSEEIATRGDSITSRRLLLREAAELALVALAFLLYFVVRANVIDRPDLASENARYIVDVERTLGIFVERDWQEAVLESSLAVRFFNFVYFWLDFPLIAAAGVWLYFHRRPEYTFTRDAILFSGAMALISYSLYPVAPPRLLPEAGIIDTLQVFNNLSYQAQSMSFFVNPFAAMPSLHVGWAVLLAVGVVRAYPQSKLVLLVAVLHPLTQTVSTVVTGNHYFLDGAGGLVAAALGLSFAVLMQRHGYAYLKQRLSFV